MNQLIWLLPKIILKMDFMQNLQTQAKFTSRTKFKNTEKLIFPKKCLRRVQSIINYKK